MYWPDELPPPKKPAPDQVSPHGGKRTYHGSHELVASNYMEVLDVLSFAGKAEVGHWLEEDDNLIHKLYWRQTFCRETQDLSVSCKNCHKLPMPNTDSFYRNSGSIVFVVVTLTPR